MAVMVGLKRRCKSWPNPQIVSLARFGGASVFKRHAGSTLPCLGTSILGMTSWALLPAWMDSFFVYINQLPSLSRSPSVPHTLRFDNRSTTGPEMLDHKQIQRA